MRILGIETSCDETSAAVVEDGRKVRSNVVSSQLSLHAEYGGVVPELASREHVRAITMVAERALVDASLSLEDIEAVAATRGPGLAGALLVGFNFGRGLALARNLPFIPVNHLEGHVYSVWLDNGVPPPFPVVILIVSGGHTELVLMSGHGDYRLLGRTLDDAAGEAFDKVGRLLGLAYPGGPAIEAAAAGASQPIDLPRAWLDNSFDFSFSGLKTAALHKVQEMITQGGSSGHESKRFSDVQVADQLDPEQVANLAAGFQESVVDVLSSKTISAAKSCQAASVAVVGGVAANRALREAMRARTDLPLYIASPEYSTDNAAMIAAAAYYSHDSTEEADVNPSLRLATA